jgi:methionine synthase II (cobalamin-independent)
MFATLIGPYPGGDDPFETIRELTAAGLEPVSDGRGARIPGAGEGSASLVADWRAAVASTSVAVKQTLLGPFSAARAVSREPMAVAEELGALVADLAAAGCRIVEIEEPEAVAVAAAGDEALRASLAVALRRLTDVVDGRAHLSLVLTGGNVDSLGVATLFDLPFASYAFDLIAGPDNWRLIAQAPGDRGIVCGALDPAAAADDRPEPVVWAAHYAASTGGRGLARVGLANASSLAELSHERAHRKVVALAEAARLASLQDPQELAKMLDPRAVDKRSAATGAFSPRRRT